MFAAHRSGYLIILSIVALYCVAAIWVTGNPVFFIYDDRPTTFIVLACLMPIFVWYLVVAANLIINRRPDPFRRIARYTRLNRKWISRSTVLIMVIALFFSAFTILKMSIPRLVPFYADPGLIRMDRMLLGTDAWRLTHAVIGPSGTVLLDWAYGVWFLVLIGFLGWAMASRNELFQVRSLLSFILIWLVLGNAMATGFSSVGPCFLKSFYGLNDFDPLMARLRGNPDELFAMKAMAYLEDMYGKTAYANGISAMPSLHVAMATWFVLVVRAGSRKFLPTALAVFYAALILVGSVHLGWHYAADGLVSITGTLAIWYMVQAFVMTAAVEPSRQANGVLTCAT